MARVTAEASRIVMSDAEHKMTIAATREPAAVSLGSIPCQFLMA
jgi:hypothetical protein